MTLNYDTPHDIGVPIDGQPVLCHDFLYTEAKTIESGHGSSVALLPARGGR